MAPKPAKPTGACKPPRSASARGPWRPRRAEDTALSTGKAARYCLVSAGSVVNWIAAGQLAAQRTVGGQFRIRVTDLRSFMRAHGMRTDAIDADYPHCSPCWVFWGDRVPEALRASQHRVCADCPVFRARAEVCSEIRPLMAAVPSHARLCAECDYQRLRAEREAAHQGQAK